jgi:hypothetical protein
VGRKDRGGLRLAAGGATLPGSYAASGDFLTLTLKPVLADDRALTTLDGDEVLEGVTLDPFGISP